MTTLQTLDSTLKRLNIGERFIRRNPLYYGTVQREIAALEKASLEERSAWSERRLRGILSVAARTPYGKSVDAPDSLEDWPLLTKESVRGRPEFFQSGGGLLNARAETGGTTGLPLQLIRSPQSVVVEQVFQDSVVIGLQIDPRNARVAVLRADSIKDPSDEKPPFWIHALGGRRLILSANHLSARTLPDYLEAMDQFGADLLWVYPTALESLCLLLQRTGVRLRVPRILSSSEVLTPEVWRLAKATLGCAIADRYGQAERVAVAHAYAPQSYVFAPGYAYVELIPQKADDDTMRHYEIVGTSLWNTAMPLVRYRTGDLIRLPREYGARELREIALGVRPFEGVIGRANDVLLRPDGEGVLIGINHIPRGVDNLLRLQVVQEAPARILLRALPAPAFTDDDARRLMANARAKIPPEADLRIELATALLRTDRGKTPFVVHDPSVRERLRRFGVQFAA
jgi:phenylacetate-coenzyme A ligase PaaK-like adenylate-forming protein